MTNADWRAELPPFSPAFREQYELLDVLGEGGMGRVYRARQTQLDREVAIKVLKSLGGEENARFHREAKVLAGLTHTRMLRVLDSGVDGGISYLVTELVRAPTLGERMKTAPFTLRESLRICARVADALAGAHGEGVIHRDVKPDNVFLLEDLEVKLADFGLARALDGDTVTATGVMMGTPDYMSPEQVGGKPLGPATDQYALGVMLYKLITQKSPFTGENIVAVALARLREPPAPPRAHCPSLPESVEEVVLRMLAQRPDDRFPTMHEAGQVLERLALELGPEGDRAYRPGVRSTGRTPVLAPGGRRPTRPAPALSGDTAPMVLPRRSRTRAAVVVLALAVALGGVGLRLRKPAPRPSVEASGDDTPRALETGRKLHEVLEALKPAERVDELRKLERAVRKLKPEERLPFLRAAWEQGFGAAAQRLMLRVNWELFAPHEAEWQASPAVPPLERLALVNQVEDLAFLSLGLVELGLPPPVDAALARKVSPGLLYQLPARMDGGTGFRFARHATAQPLEVPLDPDGGPVEPLRRVPHVEPLLIDDHFFVNAVALGGAQVESSLLEEFVRRRGEQSEYLHPEPLMLPPPEELALVVVGAHVDDLDAQHRFEIYVDTRPDGGFSRRIATFRVRKHDPVQLWQAVEPGVFPGSRVYVKVKFTVLPGLPNPYDDAELHQVTIHWRRKPAAGGAQ